MIRVGVAGAAGRMGVAACAAIEAADGPRARRPRRPGARASRSRRSSAAATSSSTSRHPTSALANARECVAAGVHVVIGTTGFDAARARGPDGRERVRRAELRDRRGADDGFAARAARHMAAAEIIELHHDRKLDAPSGTAARTAALMAAASGRPAPPIHSVRLPGLVAHQEVILGDVGQTLTIRHDSLERESFMPGMLLAVRRVGGARALARRRARAPALRGLIRSTPLGDGRGRARAGACAAEVCVALSDRLLAARRFDRDPLACRRSKRDPASAERLQPPPLRESPPSRRRPRPRAARALRRPARCRGAPEILSAHGRPRRRSSPRSSRRSTSTCASTRTRSSR